jgi:hypothetical protein
MKFSVNRYGKGEGGDFRGQEERSCSVIVYGGKVEGLMIWQILENLSYLM